MSQQASVRSFDAVARVREEVLRFGRRAEDGMTELEGQVRRVIDWVENDRPDYWKHRVLRAQEAVHEARVNLNRCLMYPINDEHPSCTEERAALKKAEAALDHAREKQQRVRQWIQTLRHELHEYRGRMGQLRTFVELDVPKGAARLERLLERLEAYAQSSVKLNQGRASQSDSSEEDSAKGEEKS